MAQKAENIELKKSNKVLKKAITSMSEDYCKDTGKKAFVIGNKTHYLSSAYTDSELCSIYLKQAKKELEDIVTEAKSQVQQYVDNKVYSIGIKAIEKGFSAPELIDKES